MEEDSGSGQEEETVEEDIEDSVGGQGRRTVEEDSGGGQWRRQWRRTVWRRTLETV